MKLLALCALVFISAELRAQSTPPLVSPERYLAEKVIVKLYSVEADTIARKIRIIDSLRTSAPSPAGNSLEKKLIMEIQSAILRCKRFKDILDDDIKF